MPLILEDGTGTAGGNAYADETILGVYCDDRAITLADGDAEAALIRGRIYIDAVYRMRFVGYKTHGRSQGCEFPRTGVLDSQYFPIANNEIPQELIDANCEAAIRELAAPFSMLPDLERGGQIRRLQAGSVAIDYGANATAITTYRVIDGILGNLLGALGQGFTAQTIRG